MLSGSKYSYLILLGFLLVITSWSCENKQAESPVLNPGKGSWNRQQAELDYKLIQTELQLAKTEQLYLFLDFRRSQLQLKLMGAVLWDCPMQFVETDSQEINDFLARFMGVEKRVMLPLGDKHLFTGQDKIPDSVLIIVGDAVHVDPELLQRDVPSRFQLFWDYGLIMEVHSEIAGKPRSILKSAAVNLRQVLRHPFGEAHIILTMNPDDALTLYRAAQPGMPALLHPSQ